MRVLAIVQLEGQLSRSSRHRTVRTVLVPMGLCELTTSVEPMLHNSMSVYISDCISVCIPVTLYQCVCQSFDATDGAIVHRSIVLIVRVVDSFFKDKMIVP